MTFAAAALVATLATTESCVLRNFDALERAGVQVRQDFIAGWLWTECYRDPRFAAVAQLFKRRR